MTNFLQAGSQIATMLGGLSVLTAVTVWITTQWRGWREQRAFRSRRTWHGYIDVGGVSSWYVRLVDVPDRPTSQVVLEVLRVRVVNLTRCRLTRYGSG
jgi:hypothetical protein